VNEVIFQHYIQKLDERFPHKELLSKTDVSGFTGMTVDAISKRFEFADNCISKARLAEALS